MFARIKQNNYGYLSYQQPSLLPTAVSSINDSHSSSIVNIYSAPMAWNTIYSCQYITIVISQCQRAIRKLTSIVLLRYGLLGNFTTGVGSGSPWSKSDPAPEHIVDFTRLSMMLICGPVPMYGSTFPIGLLMLSFNDMVSFVYVCVCVCAHCEFSRVVIHGCGLSDSALEISWAMVLTMVEPVWTALELWLRCAWPWWCA